ncbi:MAG: hypothetical protein M3Q08_13460 [Pseudomonadota bacterium]|nr:hypothetical protein [Pseudomonadota bacterium]
MRFVSALPAAALLALSACGGGGQAENAADQLEQAAEQSDPSAAPVLENAADAVREGDMNAQQAMQQAGNAQAETVPQAQPTPPSMQAKPNRGERQTPPPKIPTGATDDAAHQANSY